MRISIAMATYNGERFLPDQLNSLLDQTRLPQELVVCDDDSKDQTIDILRDFKKRAPFPVQLFCNEKNLGYTKNFEQSISLCSGELIALCDQDDIWYPEKLRRLEKGFSLSGKIGLAFSDSDLIDESGSRIHRTSWNRLGIDASRQSRLRSDPFGVLLRGPCITGMTMMFRSELRSKMLPIPREWHHDAWIALVASMVASIEPIRDRLNAYRVHAAQQTYVPLTGTTHRARLAVRAARYQEGARRYEQAKMRAESWKADLLAQDILTRLDGKIRFMKERSRIYSSFFWWPAVFRQWKQGGYALYGSGLRGAIGDLLLLGNPTKNEN